MRFTDQLISEIKSFRSGAAESEMLERRSTFLYGFLSGLEITSR
jgi:hypothetical protein